MAKTAKHREMDMLHGGLAGRLILFALPLAFSSILQQLFNSADVAVVGRFAGDAALAAVGSCVALVGIFVNLIVGLSVGPNAVLALLAERFPEVKTVMIHMGHGHGVYIDAALKMAKRFPNIYLEMSGMPMGVKIRQAYEEVGHDRIMFGTDYPFHHPSVEIQKVLTRGLDEAAMQDVFYNNAKKLLGE